MKTRLNHLHSMAMAVRVFFDAQLFSGFRFLYNRDGIYRMGVLQKYTEVPLGLIGIQPLGCDYLDLCMNEVARVVATFEVSSNPGHFSVSVASD
jgi:hypothetical protein